MEHDVRRDADNIGGQHQPAELTILRRGCQFRTAHGLDVGREGQIDGQFAGDAGTSRRNRDETRGGGEGTGFSSATDQRQFAPGR